MISNVNQLPPPLAPCDHRQVTLSRSLGECFRLPEDLCGVEVRPGLSASAGYFRFGNEMCYGRSLATTARQDPTQATYNAVSDIRCDNGVPTLPFDPDEVINNLRFERYPAGAGNTRGVLHQAYYLLRPLLPVGVRKHLQKMRLANSRTSPFPSWPIDCTADRILEQLLVLALQARQQERAPFIWFWPDGVPSCAIVTHDVEGPKGLDFCEALMDIDDSFGIKSSFQLVPERRYSVSDRIVNAIRDRGFEVNVHDLNHDGHLYSDRNQFLQRAAKINEYGCRFGAAGFRSGAMYRNLDWYDALQFSYDMSVPAVGHLEAQQGGCCTLKPYFVGSLVELPLTTTQDYSLFHILGQHSVDLWKQQVNTIIQSHGLASFIVHPDYLRDNKAQASYRSLLTLLLDLRSQGQLWIARPGEVAGWWRERSRINLINERRSWCIQGQKSKRARLAYAQLENATITYSVVARCPEGSSYNT